MLTNGRSTVVPNKLCTTVFPCRPFVSTVHGVQHGAVRQGRPAPCGLRDRTPPSCGLGRHPRVGVTGLLVFDPPVLRITGVAAAVPASSSPFPFTPFLPCCRLGLAVASVTRLRFFAPRGLRPYPTVPSCRVVPALVRLSLRLPESVARLGASVLPSLARLLLPVLRPTSKALMHHPVRCGGLSPPIRWVGGGKVPRPEHREVLMSTLKDRAAARQPQPMASEDIPAVPEIEATLFRAASENSRNQFRGRLDKAGTVRVRVYAPGDAKKLSGEVLAATVEDETDIKIMKVGDQELAKIEYRDTLAANTLVILWAPADANIEGVRITL